MGENYNFSTNINLDSKGTEKVYFSMTKERNLKIRWDVGTGVLF